MSEVERSLADIESQIVNGGTVAVLVSAARKLEAKRAGLLSRLDEMRGRMASPLSAALAECRAVGLLDTADGRLKLRTAIRRLVERIEVLIVRDGRRSIAAAHIEYQGSRQGRCTPRGHHGSTAQQRPFGRAASGVQP